MKDNLLKRKEKEKKRRIYNEYFEHWCNKNPIKSLKSALEGTRIKERNGCPGNESARKL
jgi:hypothetical protein